MELAYLQRCAGFLSPCLLHVCARDASKLQLWDTGVYIYILNVFFCTQVSQVSASLSYESTHRDNLKMEDHKGGEPVEVFAWKAKRSSTHMGLVKLTGRANGPANAATRHTRQLAKVTLRRTLDAIDELTVRSDSGSRPAADVMVGAATDRPGDVGLDSTSAPIYIVSASIELVSKDSGARIQKFQFAPAKGGSSLLEATRGPRGTPSTGAAPPAMPLFLAAMVPSQQQHTISLLTQAVQHYGAQSPEVQADVVAKCGITDAQFHQLFQHCSGGGGGGSGDAAASDESIESVSTVELPLADDFEGTKRWWEPTSGGGNNPLLNNLKVMGMGRSATVGEATLIFGLQNMFIPSDLAIKNLPLSRGVLLMLLFRIFEAGIILIVVSPLYDTGTDDKDDQRMLINKSAHESKLLLAVYLSVASFACFLAAAEMSKLLETRDQEKAEKLRELEKRRTSRTGSQSSISQDDQFRVAIGMDHANINEAGPTNPVRRLLDCWRRCQSDQPADRETSCCAKLFPPPAARARTRAANLDEVELLEQLLKRGYKDVDLPTGSDEQRLLLQNELQQEELSDSNAGLRCSVTLAVFFQLVVVMLACSVLFASAFSPACCSLGF